MLKWKKYIIPTLTILIILTLFSISGLAITVTYKVANDTYVRDTDPATNFGTEDKILTALVPGSTQIYRALGLINFTSLPSISNSSYITNATFYYYVPSVTYNADRTVYFMNCTGTYFPETTVTWNNQDTYLGAHCDNKTTVDYSTTGWKSLNIINETKNRLNLKSWTFKFKMNSEAMPAANRIININSSEAAASVRPYIVIVYSLSNYSINAQPTLANITPQVGKREQNYTTNITNYAYNGATQIYVWRINSTTGTILKNSTDSTGKWLKCSDYSACRPSALLYVSAKALGLVRTPTSQYKLNANILGFGKVANDSISEYNGTLTNYNLRNGTNNNTPTYNTSGVFSGSTALFYDGVNEGTYINDDNQLEDSTAFTIHLSVFPYDDGSDAYIITKRQSSEGYFIYYDSSLLADGFVRTANGNCQIGTSSARQLTNQSWNNLTLRYTGTRLELFKNGVLMTGGNISCTGSVANNTQRLTLAMRYPSIYGKMGIDNVYMYNRSLSTTEIQALNGNRNNYPISGDKLIALYNFEEGTGTTVYDRNPYVVGKVREAMRFDGVNDYVSLPSSIYSQVSKTRNFTISGWFKTNMTTPTSQTLIQTSDGTGTDRFAILVQTGGSIVSGVYNGAYVGKRSGTFTTGTFNHLVYSFEEDTLKGTLFINGINQTGTSSPSATATAGGRIGARTGGEAPFNGSIDDFRIYNLVLSPQEIQAIYNSGSGTENATPSAKSTESAFKSASIYTFYKATLTNTYNSSAINGVTLTATGSNTTTRTNATGNIVYLPLGNGAWVMNFTKTGYYNKATTFTITTNNSINQSITLTPLVYFSSITYSNYTEYSNVNYTRNLTFTINATCPSNSTTKFNLRLNKTTEKNISVTCNNQDTITNSFYSHVTEGTYNVSFYFNTTASTTGINTLYFGNQRFTFDLNNPTINLNFTRPSGFTSFNTNVSLLCNDTIAPVAEYYFRFNNKQLYYKNKSINTYQTNETALADGTNTAFGSCSDLFGSINKTVTDTIYTATVYLIDEKTNTAFDLDNITAAKLYIDDNSTYYDFKLHNKSNVNFTATNITALRLELSYPDGSIITRWVDIALLSGDIRICANKDDVVHYPQLMYSTTERRVILLSVYANCVVAADYTRFAFGDALVLRAYTIDTLYNLFIFDGNEQYLLASIDGGITGEQNLDNLLFRQTQYNFNILTESLSFNKIANGLIEIYYKNSKDDTDSVLVTITSLDTGEVGLNSTLFTDPNEFTINFNYSSMLNVTNATIFKITILKTTDGEESTFSEYFSPSGNAGSLNPKIAFVLGFLFMIFGLTFAISRDTFSWFGIIITLISLAILGTSTGAWYITLMQAIDIIILAFIGIVMYNKNYSTVA